MPASSKRYQSRLFNLILQQSIRWTDRAAETFRTVQVATVWGIQALLYPVYAVVQATRNSLGKSASSPAQQFAPPDETPIPDSDAPIQIVLADIEQGTLDVTSDAVPEFRENTFKSPSISAKLAAITDGLKSGLSWIAKIVRLKEDSSASIVVSQPANLAQNHVNKLGIRGIASSIAEHKLVLVNTGNQILDILNFQQQQQLERRIFIEIGNYWMARQPVREERLPAQKPNRLLAWMQTSPLAISLNLFQEATVASRPKNTRSIPKITSDLPDFSPESSAALQASSILSVNPVQYATADRWHSILQSTQTSLAETQQFIVEKMQQVRFPQISDPWQGVSDSSQDDRSSTISSEDRNFFSPKTSRKALPTAPQISGNYYHKVAHIVKSVSDSCEKNLARVTDRFVQIADPWLSPLEQSELTHTENPINRDSRSKVQLKLGDRSLKQLPASRSLERSFEQVQTWAKDSRNWLAEWGIPGLEPIPEMAVESPSIAPEILQTDRSPTRTEAIEVLSNPFVWQSAIATFPNAPQSDWIETEATSVEYIKHPLEKVLGWLDRMALWIEEHIVQLWQSLQRFWSSLLGSHK